MASSLAMSARNLVFIFIVYCIAGGFTFRQQTINTSLQFKNKIGDKELVLFDETYTNGFGEPFTVTKFRYYISNISFLDAGSKETVMKESYYLINEADSLSKTIQLTSSAPLVAISFWIGVDSIKNISGVQTGSLDPINGMFWTWNSGYVFAKLEGQSDSSHAPAHGLTWDVGGFRKQQNALRKITLTLEKNPTANRTVTINADILKWFDGAHPLRIAQSPTCHQPGVLAMQIADNYSAMFSVAP